MADELVVAVFFSCSLSILFGCCDESNAMLLLSRERVCKCVSCGVVLVWCGVEETKKELKVQVSQSHDALSKLGLADLKVDLIIANCTV